MTNKIKFLMSLNNTVITSLKNQDEINSNHIKELYKQCKDLFERQETIGALDLHRMLTITTLGFENKPVNIAPSSPKKSEQKSPKKLKKQMKIDDEVKIYSKNKSDEEVELGEDKSKFDTEKSVQLIELQENGKEKSVSFSQAVDNQEEPIIDKELPKQEEEPESEEEEEEDIQIYSDEVSEDGGPDGNNPKIYNLNTLK